MPAASKQGQTLFMLCLAVALLAFYWPWLINASSFFRNDLTAFWHPLVMFNAEAIHRLRLPLWNPYAGCGIPQVAILTPGIFFPPNWLFAWLPFNTALAIVLIADHMVAAVGVFLLILDLGWGGSAAAFAAVTASLSGFFFSTQTSYALNATAAWFPLTFFCLRRLLRSQGRPQRGWLVATAFCVLMFVTAGVPEVFLPGMLLMAVYVPAASRDGGKISIKTVAIAYGALAAGVLLAMPALLPAAEWAQLSKRSSGLNLKEVFTWSVGWYDLVSLILPQPFGDTMSVDNRFVRLFMPSPLQTQYLPSSYFGASAATFALLGLVSSWRGRRVVVGLLAVLLFAVLGNNTPVAPFVVNTFHLAAFRYPVKLMCFIVFAAALLAAAGMKIILEAPNSVRKANVVLACAWLLLAIAGVCLVAAPASFATLPPFTSQSVPFDTSAAAAWRIGSAAIQAGSCGLLMCALCWLLCAGRIRPIVFVSSTVVLQATLLLSAAWVFARAQGPADYYALPSALQQRFARLNSGSVDGLRVALIQADMRPPATRLDPSNRTLGLHEYMRSVLIPLANMDYKIGSSITFVVGQTRDLDTLAWDTLKAHGHGNDLGLARYCQLSSTRYIYAPMHMVSPDGRIVSRLPALDARFFRPVDYDEPDNICIYEVLNPMPRAYLTSAVKWAGPHSAVLDFITHPTMPGFDPHESTFLEKTSPAAAAPNLVPGPSNAISAVSLENGLNHSTVKLTAMTDSFLVTTDQFYPGWKAALDGKDVPIYCANGLLRAVFVPAGRHVIEFCYRPLSLLIGLTVAFITFVCVLSVCISTVAIAQRKVTGG